MSIVLSDPYFNVQTPALFITINTAIAAGAYTAQLQDQSGGTIYYFDLSGSQNIIVGNNSFNVTRFKNAGVSAPQLGLYTFTLSALGQTKTRANLYYGRNAFDPSFTDTHFNWTWSSYNDNSGYQASLIDNSTGRSYDWQYNDPNVPAVILPGRQSFRLSSFTYGGSPIVVSYGTSYTFDFTYNSNHYYATHTNFTCFLEGTKIRCADGEKAIETLRPGDLVVTDGEGTKPIACIGHSIIFNYGGNNRHAQRLYRLRPANYPALTEDLVITGHHSVLVPAITKEQETAIIKELGEVFLTGDYFRLPACIDDRAEPVEVAGFHRVWHLALENDNIFYNYAIFANGLVTESCSIRYLKEKSGMTLV